MDKNKVIESASKLVAKGAFDKAVKEYQRVLEVDPDDVRVLQKLAELYQKMKKPSEAADCFEKVARTYSAQGFYLKAVALYKQVLKVVERIEVNVRLAELYQQLGLVGDAAKEWQAVATHYEKIGDSKASLDTLKKLVDLDPDNVASRIRLGEQYARQDNLVEAVAELRRAAQYLQRNGRQDDYLRVIERISHLDQSDAALAKELAEHYLSRGDSKRALAKLQICFKANPRDLGTLQMLARAFQDLGQTSKTVSVLKELARVHLDAGRAEDARKVYQQAVELAPDDPEVRAGLGQAEQGGGGGRAEPASTQRLPTPPAARAKPAAPPPAPAPRSNPPPRPAAQAIAPPPPSRPAAAPRAAEPPISADSIPKLLKETEVYVKYGLHDKALEHLRKVLATDPDNLEAHEKSKTLALLAGRTADAVAELATLVKLYGGARDPRSQAARAELRKLDPRHPAAAGSGPAPKPQEQELELADEPLELEAADEESISEAELAPEVEAADEPFLAAPDAEIEPDGAAHAGGDEDAYASDLAEADFYLESGLADEARAVLQGILLAQPQHPGAQQRLMRAGARPAPAPFRPKPGRPVPAAKKPKAAPAADHDDMAAELAAELAAEVGSITVDEDAPLDGDALDSFQVPASEVLGEFRAKLREVVRPEDVQTHYDLGIAYKEMGLLEEAAGEFEVALRHSRGDRRADCLIMLGMCEIERGNAQAAVKMLKEGLSLDALKPEARRALLFELGMAHEAIGEGSVAVEHYREVASEEPGFRDVAERIQKLAGSARVKPRAAVGAKPGPAKPPAETPDPSGSRNRKIGFV